MPALFCIITGCERPHEAKGYCGMHYLRFKRTGDPMGRRCGSCGRHLAVVLGEHYQTAKYCSDECKPRCAATCDRASRKDGLCEAHFDQRKRTGRTWSIRAWGEAGSACEFCDDPVPLGCGGRRFCSPRCKALWRRWLGARPGSRSCAGCESVIDLTFVHPSGRIRPGTTRLCERCRARHRFGMSVNQLAARDGISCSICGEDVDMALRRPESLFGPSIDHVTPRARGGTDDPSNLALAHYWCNAVKSDRECFTI